MNYSRRLIKRPPALRGCRLGNANGGHSPTCHNQGEERGYLPSTPHSNPQNTHTSSIASHRTQLSSLAISATCHPSVACPHAGSVDTDRCFSSSSSSCPCSCCCCCAQLSLYDWPRIATQVQSVYKRSALVCQRPSKNSHISHTNSTRARAQTL